MYKKKKRNDKWILLGWHFPKMTEVRSSCSRFAKTDAQSEAREDASLERQEERHAAIRTGPQTQQGIFYWPLVVAPKRDITTGSHRCHHCHRSTIPLPSFRRLLQIGRLLFTGAVPFLWTPKQLDLTTKTSVQCTTESWRSKQVTDPARVVSSHILQLSIYMLLSNFRKSQ